MAKLVFFDVDGTLSVPIYPDGGREVIGFSDEGWLEYCRTAGEDGYRLCKPVEPVKRYAEKCLSEGSVLYVLTTSQMEEETAAKRKFVERHYAGLFAQVLDVRHDKEKLDAMREKAQEHGLLLTDCELVEDTFATLLYVMQAGVKATHIASLVCDL